MDEIKKVIKGEVFSDEETLEKYSRDASIFRIKPKLVIVPKDINDLESLVKFVNSSKQKYSLTIRAAGTDMTGGAINDSLILDMKNFNQFLEIEQSFAKVQPGVMYKDFDLKTREKNLFMPVYPASRELCTVGGMVANNAGGELDLTYGEVGNFIEELKVILGDGQEYVVKPLNKAELDKKIKQNDYEGNLYKEIFELITKNQSLITNSKPKVTKNSTGYLIWEVWDGQTFDLTKLFIGSQGTLGIITEIKFRLIETKKDPVLLVINLSNLDALDQIVNQVLEFKPESFECFDKETLELAIKYSSELIKDFKLNSNLKAKLGFLSWKVQMRTHKLPELVMMANFVGTSKKEALTQAKKAQQALKKFKVSTTLCPTPASAEKYWLIRHKSFGLLRAHSGNLQASSFIDDIIVKPAALPEFLPKLNALIAPYKDKMVYTLAGHIGDGNFHIIPLMDLGNPEVRKIIPEIMEKVFSLVFEYGGSMSAEHNDGLIRGPYLEKMYGKAMLNLFKEIKRIFDPKNIFNPHKKADSSFEYSQSHMLEPNKSLDK